MKNMHRKFGLQGYSLVEMIVTIAIAAIVLAMLSNVLVVTVTVSQRAAARSFVREEVTDIVDRIANDVRQAKQIVSCNGGVCQLDAGGIVTWEVCVDGVTGLNAVCKRNASGVVVYKSSENFELAALTFDVGFDAVTVNSGRRNILLTVVGNHANPLYNVTNVVNQVAVSTRNYLLIN